MLDGTCNIRLVHCILNAPWGQGQQVGYVKPEEVYGTIVLVIKFPDRETWLEKEDVWKQEMKQANT